MCSDKVVVNDVSPRDGLQNQSKILTPEERVQLIEALVAAGVKDIEVGSFVSPKAVPAMAGTDEVFSKLGSTGNDTESMNFSALIPNKRGYDNAVAIGVKTLSFVLAASETMNQKNVNLSVDESIAIYKALNQQAKQDGAELIACVATAWECPFEGKISELAVEKVVLKLLDAGAKEIVFADTIGAADPAAVKSLMQRMVALVGADGLACHFHDTRGYGVANLYAALEAGIRKFDASVGGLGGCPFAPGASGNIATEDMVLALHQMGFSTGIDLKALVAAADMAAELTGVTTGGNASKWLKRQIEKGLL